MRSAAFVSGGLVEKSVRGTVHTGIVSITDHAATLLDLAGLSAAAMGARPGFDSDVSGGAVPPLDGVSLWPVISGRVRPCSPNFYHHR